MGRFHHVVRCLVLAAGVAAVGPIYAQPGLPGLPGGGSSTVTGPLEMSCDGVDAIACKSVGRLEYVGICDDDDGDGVCNRDDRCADTPADTPVFLDGCHLSANQPAVLTGVRFEFDSARLRPESRTVLEQALTVLRDQSGVFVSIDGHTDAKGGEAYNQRLSYARARSVFDYFRQAGIDTARLVYRGFGESRPVEPNRLEDGSDNPAGRARNRRVELTVVDEIEFQSIRTENRSRATVSTDYSASADRRSDQADSDDYDATDEATPSEDARSVSEEPSANQEPSAGEEPSANQEPSAGEEPSAGDPDASAEASSEQDSSLSDDNEQSADAEPSADDTTDSDDMDSETAEDDRDEYGEWDDLDYLD